MAAAEPARDGRRRHPVDRALDFRALERAGLTGAQIARRRRKSPGYVSVLLRLGRVLEPLAPEEQAALRSPRITVGLIQRIVRVGVPDAEVRAQLRAAVSGVSRHNLDRRRDRRRQDSPLLSRGVAAAAGPSGGRPSAAGSPAGLAGWAWDQALWEADPEQYVRDLMTRVEGLHATVLARARRAARDAAARRLDAGQSIRSLAQRVLATSHAGASTGADRLDDALAPAARRALKALAFWGHGLAAAASGAARQLHRPTEADLSPDARPAGRTPPTPPSALQAPPVEVSTTELEDALRD